MNIPAVPLVPLLAARVLAGENAADTAVDCTSPTLRVGTAGSPPPPCFKPAQLRQFARSIFTTWQGEGAHSPDRDQDQPTD